VIKIIQYFDKDEIRSLSYGKELYCIRDAREHGMMDKMQMCKVPPQDINKLLEDDSNMFVIFEKEKE